MSLRVVDGGVIVYRFREINDEGPLDLYNSITHTQKNRGLPMAAWGSGQMNHAANSQQVTQGLIY